MKIEYTVNKLDGNLMLKNVLKQKLEISSSLLRDIVKNNAVKVNGEVIYLTNRVKEGDYIAIDFDKTIEAKSEESRYEKNKIEGINNRGFKKLDIVYEDEYILAINKQAGISAHPNSNQKDNTLTEQVYNYYKERGYNHKIHIVNRLDRNTSGICVFAKHKYVQELISKAIKTDNTIKEYIAVAHGKMVKSHGLLEGKIARKQGTIILREVSELGDAAKTEYFVESYNKEKNYSVLRLILHTGRTHQIRVHMADIGHPLLGDELYIDEAKQKCNIDNICTDIDRQALHAKKVNIRLDILELDVELNAEIPEDIRRLI